MSVTADSRAVLRDRAAAVLRGNDAGSWTKASPILYPHQWSWDSAFIAIGWAHLDVRRAMTELEQLFAAQWATGHGAAPRVPGGPRPGGLSRAGVVGHFRLPGGAGAPRKRRPGSASHRCMPWRCSGSGKLTPQARQPEIRARIQALYPRMVDWHRYLATYRDPEASGLVTTYHPWEGTDNSPRWDRALERITVAKPGPYTCLDTRGVSRPVAAAHQGGLRPVSVAGPTAPEIRVRRRADLPRVPVPDQGRVLLLAPSSSPRMPRCLTWLMWPGPATTTASS